MRTIRATLVPDIKDPRVPAAIRNHPGVKYTVPGLVEGSDYRFWIELHNDWQFTHGSKAGAAAGGFHSVADFRYASPKRKT